MSKSLENVPVDITLEKTLEAVSKYPTACQRDSHGKLLPTFTSEMNLQLIEATGSEHFVATVARVSTVGYSGQDMQNISEEELERSNRLCQLLVHEGHGSPLEHITFDWFLHVPIFVSRQVVKYRQTSINEQSARYSKFEPQFYLPLLSTRPYVQTGKPMDYQFKEREEYTEAEDKAMWKLVLTMREQCTDWYESYREALDAGISREVARMSMPVNTMTSMYVRMNLRETLHFIGQRVYNPTADRPSHGQYEIEQVALAMAHEVKNRFPYIWEAWVETNYRKL